MKIGADADPQARLYFPSSSRRWRVNARVVLQPRRRGVCCDDKGPSIIYFGVVPATSLSGLADMVRSCGIVKSAGLPPDT